MVSYLIHNYSPTVRLNVESNSPLHRYPVSSQPQPKHNWPIIYMRAHKHHTTRRVSIKTTLPVLHNHITQSNTSRVTQATSFWSHNKTFPMFHTVSVSTTRHTREGYVVSQDKVSYLCRHLASRDMWKSGTSTSLVTSNDSICPINTTLIVRLNQRNLELINNFMTCTFVNTPHNYSIT